MKIIKVRSVRTPERATSKSAGIDFFAPDDYVSEEIMPLDSVVIRTGVFAKIPKGFMLEIKNRSSMAIAGWQVGACVIDEDYQGEIKIHLINLSNKVLSIDKTKAIAQGVLVPVSYEGIEVRFSKEDLYTEATNRGAGGFGSTNKN